MNTPSKVISIDQTELHTWFESVTGRTSNCAPS